MDLSREIEAAAMTVTGSRATSSKLKRTTATNLFTQLSPLLNV